METTKTPRKSGVSYIGAFFAMLITFLAGIFVGAHPLWVPNKWFAGDNGSGKPVIIPSGGNDDPSMDTTRPTTKPVAKP